MSITIVICACCECLRTGVNLAINKQNVNKQGFPLSISVMSVARLLALMTTRRVKVFSFDFVISVFAATLHFTLIMVSQYLQE